MKKYRISKDNKKILNRYGLYINNAVTSPDERTRDKNIAITDEISVKEARDWQEESEK